jgi:hypothetical protein
MLLAKVSYNGTPKLQVHLLTSDKTYRFCIITAFTSLV